MQKLKGRLFIVVVAPKEAYVIFQQENGRMFCAPHFSDEKMFIEFKCKDWWFYSTPHECSAVDYVANNILRDMEEREIYPSDALAGKYFTREFLGRCENFPSKTCADVFPPPVEEP